MALLLPVLVRRPPYLNIGTLYTLTGPLTFYMWLTWKNWTMGLQIMDEWEMNNQD